jgi:hypothetical protein
MVEKLKAQKNNAQLSMFSVSTAEKGTVETVEETISTNNFEQGDKVFHEAFGIGNVEDVIKIGSSIMYKVDFGPNGKKAIDATFCRLKKV